MFSYDGGELVAVLNSLFMVDFLHIEKHFDIFINLLGLVSRKCRISNLVRFLISDIRNVITDKKLIRVHLVYRIMNRFCCKWGMSRYIIQYIYI
jgi:hypothetical protein